MTNRRDKLGERSKKIKGLLASGSGLHPNVGAMRAKKSPEKKTESSVPLPKKERSVKILIQSFAMRTLTRPRFLVCEKLRRVNRGSLIKKSIPTGCAYPHLLYDVGLFYTLLSSQNFQEVFFTNGTHLEKKEN